LLLCNDKAVVKIMFILPEIYHLGDYVLNAGLTVSRQIDDDEKLC